MLLNRRLIFFGGGRRPHGLELVGDRLERSKLRNFPQEGHNLSSFCIKYLVAVCDACSSFQNDDMFVFILMSVHQRAIAGTGDDFNGRRSGFFCLPPDESHMGRATSQTSPAWHPSSRRRTTGNPLKLDIVEFRPPSITGLGRTDRRAVVPEFRTRSRRRLQR
jgi:hypothetical protein